MLLFHLAVLFISSCVHLNVRLYQQVVQASWDSRVVGDFPKAARSVFASRGVNGLFAGMWPAMLRAFPANAALFVGYEATRDAIKKW